MKKLHSAIRSGADRPRRRFVRHFVEMVVAMFVGMMALGPVWTLVFDRLGWFGLHDRPDVHALIMATDMTIGMSLWMRYRAHTWISIAEMGAAMYVPFVVLLIPFWAGVLTGEAMVFAGHVLMFPCMIVAILRRPDEYMGDHSGHAAVTG